MISDHPIQCLSGGTAVIYAEQDELPVIPDGFQQLFVLTNAFSLTILDVAVTPQFEVDHVGFYRIHSLVYDPGTLDLSIVAFGETTAFDILPALQQGGGAICASLDVHGAVNLVIPQFICTILNNFFGQGRGVNPEVAAVNNWVNTYNSYESFERDMLAEAITTSVYPNPVRGQLNINTTILDDEVVTYIITDIQGRILRRGVLTHLTNGNHQMNMRNLSKGTYIIQLNSEYRNFTTKVQVMQ
jgi:hypothetical protein